MKGKESTWLLNGLLWLAVIAGLGMGIYAVTQINGSLDRFGMWSPDCDCCYERERAVRIFGAFNNAINLLTTDPVHSTEIIAAYFAPFGEWSVPFYTAPIVGPLTSTTSS